MKKQQKEGCIIDGAHYHFEEYKQRITTNHWKEMLLDHRDTIIFDGEVRKLIAKNLGYGVVEISKEPKCL